MGGCGGTAKVPAPEGKPIALIIQFESGEQRIESVYSNQPVSDLQRRLVPRLVGAPTNEWEAQSEELQLIREGQTELAMQLPLHLEPPAVTLEHNSLEFAQAVLGSDVLWGDTAIAAGSCVYMQDKVWQELFAAEVERLEAFACDLMASCKANETDVVERVLTLAPERAHEAFPAMHNNTLLHVAARASKLDSHFRLVELIIAHSVDPNLPNQWEYKALHYSGWTGDNPRLCQALLDAGAKVDSKNVNGRTALHFAENYRHMRTVEVLKNAETMQCC